MALIERDGFMALLQKKFDNIAGGEGHCVLVSGEAGIGKTALVKAFCRQQAETCSIYQGACDGLFTPRPLAPLYDVLWQVNSQRWPVPPSNEERSVLFANFFQELLAKKEKVLMVFEDIHWADEGTLDFIKFFVRRIYQLPCLFILTYRDNEIYSRHPLRNVLGQLPPDSFTKLVLTPLSKHAVVELATQKGYSGEDVYSISEGNPFYVNEILASYSPGVPENIKDAILAVYERQQEGTKNAWQLFSVIPEGLEVDRFARIKSDWDEATNHCFAICVIVVQQGKVVFKHELYRRTIEESLTPFKRIELNKLMLELYLDSFKEKGEIERILHYAKNANEKELVVKYAPEAAEKAASIGAHQEACKLYLTAIEYFDGKDNRRLAELYKAYAVECYLSNQVKEAIAVTEKEADLRNEIGDINKYGDSLIFLSRLWWFEGNRQHAEQLAAKAIDLLKDWPVSPAKASAFSNMAQLNMLAGETDACLLWGKQAIDMAIALNNEAIHAHALNNLGATQLLSSSTEGEGIDALQQCLDISLMNGYHEHAANAWTTIASVSVRIKNYGLAKKALNDGIRYCEEKGLNFWITCMLSWKARAELEQGNCTAAHNIADNLLKNENQPAIIRITARLVLAKIIMRTGEKDALSLLTDAKRMAFETMELQRMVPAVTALLEYEWLTGKTVIEPADMEQTLERLQLYGIDAEKKELAFWLKKAGRPLLPCKEMTAAWWQNLGCPYEQALVLFDGNDDDKRKAIAMVQDLGAGAVYEKMKQEMKTSGMKNIPRGIRNSTRSNIAFLTEREMEIIQLLKEGLQNKEIAARLHISAKTVDHHISSILFKLDAGSRSKAVTQAVRMGILK